MALICPIALAANQVPAMELDVLLFRDGSARVTQVMEAETRGGAEFYLALHDSGYLRFTDFTVSDEYKEYTYEPGWDLGASFEEKAGRFGTVDMPEGVELCWGISQYGSCRYTVGYTIHGLVGAYSDTDGFNHRFVDEMGTFPTDVKLTIRSEEPLTDESCDIWGFGYDGDVRFRSGTMIAQTRTPLESGQHMTVMVSLEKGLLSPERIVDGSFEAVKEQAFEGSDYDDVTFKDVLLFLGILALAVALIGLGAAIVSFVRRARLRRRMKRVQYFRDAPNSGNMNVTHRLGAACGLCRENSLLGAYLLRLICAGALEPVWSGNRVALRLVRPPRDSASFEGSFYELLKAAAGPDGLLQAQELESFYEQDGGALLDFVEACRKDADLTLVRGGCLRGGVCTGTKSLTRQGWDELDEILGLKRFLLDFSLMQERHVQETVLWQEYMIYAHLLGIAEQTAAQLRELYPNSLPEVERFQQYIGYTGYYNGILYSACERHRQRVQAARSAGSGGRASFGGGGGFSGGGGGGTR